MQRGRWRLLSNQRRTFPHDRTALDPVGMSAARRWGQQGDPATASAAVTASQLRAEQGNLSSWKAETGRLLRSEPASSGMSAASAASSTLQTPHPSRSKPPGAHGLTTGRVLARHALLS